MHTSAEGGFSPLTLAPRLSLRRGLLNAFGGYDAARQAPIAESAANVVVLAPVTLRLGTVYSADRDALRPSLGVSVLVLKQERQAVDVAATILYRAEGFSESEGEVEFVAAFGRTFGPTRFNLNLVYGQDAEGRERDGEVRLSSLSRVASQVYAGMDARCRIDMAAEDMAKSSRSEASFDVLAGPLLNVVLGPLSLFAGGGVAVVGWEHRSTAVGAAMLAGAGTAL